ncbi:hypothetical protein A0H81_01091 [Grifola frondosa]|uniref:EamA domain-containing protein n=1 Tax=Grifola frondosa TaxID=5627 RepID=A0A1C7MQQ0_GRIFR|nr:hypothetical protein A0H81_01091 [Grifola frondosa]
MTPRRDGITVNLGGRLAVGLFIVCLFAFVAETQLSQYVQSKLDFRQPFLIFYIVHSSFVVMFPLHFLYLLLFSKNSPRAIWAGLMFAMKRHLSPTDVSAYPQPKFPTWRFVRLLLYLTVGMTVPSLLWFVAVSLAPVTDVTALWNTNAFFAYVFTVKLFQTKWESRRLAAVVVATTGALAVIYGGSSAGVDKSSASNQPHSLKSSEAGPSGPLLGDLLTLCASIMYAAYQVLYKIYAALPSDPELQTDDLYTSLATSPEDVLDADEGSPESSLLSNTEMVHPPPFGLHANLLTSAIGICTFAVLWIPLPILHVLNIEPFELPTSSLTMCVIAGIALTGVIFNAVSWFFSGLGSDCHLSWKPSHYRACLHLGHHLWGRGGHNHGLGPVGIRIHCCALPYLRMTWSRDVARGHRPQFLIMGQ